MTPKTLDWTRADDILIDPQSDPKPCPPEAAPAIESCVHAVRNSRARGAGVILMYGAHLLRNGAARILDRMMERRWLTHVATNGAGTIHDWEYAWLGRSTESVEQNVATGTFGAWDETGRNLHLALLAGALRGEGYGASLGRFITEDGTDFPAPESLENAIRDDPQHPLTPARADLLQTMLRHRIRSGRARVEHNWKQASILASAFRHGIPATVHPGIGYDITLSSREPSSGAPPGSTSGSSVILSRLSTVGSSSLSAPPSWPLRSSRRASVASIISGSPPDALSSRT